MVMNIRPAIAADKEAILDVIGSYRAKWDRSIAKRYYDVYFSGGCQCLSGDSVSVLALDGEVVGVTGYSIDRYETGNYWLGWIYVHANHWHKGLGTKLLAHTVEELRRKRLTRLFVTTSSHPFYHGAQDFYARNGFIEVARIPDYYETGEHQIIVCKQL
jgi:GNAT superfamily N-acetyltransferase